MKNILTHTAIASALSASFLLAGNAEAQSQKLMQLTSDELMNYSFAAYSKSRDGLTAFEACTRDGHVFYMQVGARAPIPALQDKSRTLPVDEFLDGLGKVFVDAVARFDYDEFHTGEQDPAAYLAVEKALGDYVDTFADRHNILLGWSHTKIGWSPVPVPQCGGPR